MSQPQWSMPSMPPGQYVPHPEERTWAIAAHVGQLLLGFIAPMVVWLAKGDQSPFLKHQGKQGLNFVLTCYLVLIFIIPLYFGGAVLMGTDLQLLGIPMLVLSVVLYLALIAAIYIMPIVAAVKGTKPGVAWYRYPGAIQFFK